MPLVNIPSSVVAGVQTVVSILVQSATSFSYANLAGSGTVTLSVSILSAPIVDISVFMDQAGSIQIATRSAASGSGSTYRNLPGGAFNVLASTLFQTSLRVIGRDVQVTLTNSGAVLTTTLEFVIYSRAE